MSFEISLLTTKLATLNASLKQTLQLIQQLSRIQSPTSDSSSLGLKDDEDVRTDLTASIREQLRTSEDELEILRQDVTDIDSVQAHASGRSSRRSLAVGRDTDLQRAVARCLSGCEKLAEDLRLTRTRFRRAQLTAKANAERAVQRERAAYLASLQAAAAATTAAPNQPEASRNSLDNPQKPTSRFTDLFAGRRPRPRPDSTAATKDDILLTATSDVTSSLRRTHNLLQSELSRSQFAQETLAASNAALEELNSRYNTFDDLLSKSRGLLGTLLRSQKSDTWYLETAIAILIGTIGWLVFRRFLYGPLWWVFWMPLKLAFNLLWSVGWALGVVGGKSAAEANALGRTTVIASATASPTMAVESLRQSQNGEARGDGSTPHDPSSTSDSLSDSIVAMMQASGSATPDATPPAGDNDKARGDAHQNAQQDGDQAEAVRRGDGQVLPERDEATQPRNPKKRMMEEPSDDLSTQQDSNKKDEL